MKFFLSLLIMSLVISMALPVYAQAPIPIKANIPETFQGTNSIGDSMSSMSWLEWKIIYQDGTESGTTQFAQAQFEPFPLSFVGENEMLRTLISAEIRGITSFAGIGNELCHDLPSQTYKVETKVNGITVDIPKQLFGSNEFNQITGINKGFGVKFAPAFIESQLAQKGVELKTGDVITWKISSDNRFTLYRGEVINMIPFDQFSPIGSGTCEAIRGTAWDAYTVGMGFEQKFIFVDPFEQIITPTTTEPDLDGDGIPDRIDQCDFSPERFNGFQDTDGCPDNDPVGFDPTIITDQDGDGILDMDDLCPNEPEIFNSVEDGDGCPDGASLDVNFISFEATGQEVVDLTKEPIPEPLPPIIPVMESETTPVIIDDVNAQMIQDNPLSNFGVPEQNSDDPILTTGTSDSCDRFTQDCNQVIRTAIQQGTGIMVPFELSLINLILIFAIIAGAVLIIMILRRKK